MTGAQPTTALGFIDLPALAHRGAVDTRPRLAAEAGHLPGSAWLPVPDPLAPATALPSFLLPPPGSPLTVVADDPAAARAIAEHLSARGYAAAYLAEPFPTPDQARAAGVTLATGLPTGHLWQPDPFLNQHLHLLPPATAGPIADLGCGSGRDAVFLALRGYDVLAIDRLADALELTRRRAAHHAVTVRVLQADLRRPADLARLVESGPFAAVLLIRVHQPDTLRALPRLVSPGGIALVHGFARREGLPAAVQPTAAHATVRTPARPGTHERRPKAALSLDELNAAFAPADWETLVALDPPPGADRALAARIARRRA